MKKENRFLYRQLADRIANQIAEGLLIPGDKLNSVRALSKQMGISMSTVFQAYCELEMLGLIEARPKSGYYVKSKRRLTTSSSKSTNNPELKVRGVDDLISMVYNSRSVEHLLALSKATPYSDLIPIKKLNHALAEAIRKSSNACTYYEDVQGNPLLRQQIARLAFNWGGQITADDIVTTNGCMEAITYCLKAITKPGDTVAIDCPTYFGIFQVMKSLGLNVLEIPSDPHEGIRLDLLENAINRFPIKACLFVLNFNNPLGCLMPETNKQRLVKLLKKHEIPLIEDDIYGELYFGNIRPSNAGKYDHDGWVITCGSVSKALAPGYRVGWCIPGRYKEDVIRSKLMQSVSACHPTHAAVGEFMAHGRFELHLRNLRKELKKRCMEYRDCIQHFFPEGTHVSDSKGGYILWIELPEKNNAFDLYQDALKQNISISPGQIYSTDGRFKHHIRISYGLAFNERVEQGIKTLASLVKH
jgi:DNA-binding transcriptional MocR family regulator